MLAYKLRYKIEIWENQETRNTFGAISKADVLIDSVYADVQTSMGRVATTDDRVLHSTETTFFIRNHPQVTYKNFIKFNGDKYRIIGVQELPDRTGQIIKTVLNN